MARFYGRVGFGETVDQGGGIHKLVITERIYSGDVIRDYRQVREGDKVNDDITLGNSISVVGDSYATEHFFAIRYVEWKGALWKVTDVETESPRLILRVGGVYNGPTGTAPDSP